VQERESSRRLPASVRALARQQDHVVTREQPAELEVIGDVAGGAQSLPELDYSRALRRAGSPSPPGSDGFGGG